MTAPNDPVGSPHPAGYGSCPAFGCGPPLFVSERDAVVRLLCTVCGWGAELPTSEAPQAAVPRS